MTSAEGPAGGTCPLCLARSRAEDRYLWWLLQENYGEPATLEHLAGRRFCGRHARRLLEAGHAGLSRTMEYLLTAARAHLDRPPGPPRRAAWRRRGPPSGVPGCPACEAGENAALAERDRWVRRMAADADARAAYATDPDLCYPHLESVLAAAPPGVDAWLRTVTRARFDRWQDLLALYFHRLDVRFHDEPRGREQEVWRALLAFFWPPDPS